MTLAPLPMYCTACKVFLDLDERRAAHWREGNPYHYRCLHPAGDVHSVTNAGRRPNPTPGFTS
jgi:hypothetical protein